jgi:hypothetical protein
VFALVGFPFHTAFVGSKVFLATLECFAKLRLQYEELASVMPWCVGYLEPGTLHFYVLGCGSTFLTLWFGGCVFADRLQGLTVLADACAGAPHAALGPLVTPVGVFPQGVDEV